MTRRAAVWLTLVLASPAAGCASHAAIATYGDLPTVLPATRVAPRSLGFGRTNPPIQHVVIIVQENRSFDNLFQGYPGADTQSWGLNSKGQKIELQSIPLEAPYDIDHLFNSFTSAYDGGKMDGFDLEPVYGHNLPSNPQYGFVPASESKTYFNLAKQYVLADHMFTSHVDGSFVSHQYVIAAQAERSVNLPSGVWGCDGGKQDDVQTLKDDRTYGRNETVCFPSQTLGDELDAAGLSWRYYAASPLDGWQAYQAVRHIRYGADWKNIYSPSEQFETDVAGGTLAAVTWITPNCTYSDHGGCVSNQGPAYVARLINAVGRSNFWDSTTIFVMWDEWGGWYDHVPPPKLDYDGLGLRVPLLIVSPYAKHGYVSHVLYEHGSLLRYVEDIWGLPQLAQSDKRANDPAADAFDYTLKPRAFRPIDTSRQPGGAFAQPADVRPVDPE